MYFTAICMFGNRITFPMMSEKGSNSREGSECNLLAVIVSKSVCLKSKYYEDLQTRTGRRFLVYWYQVRSNI